MSETVGIEVQKMAVGPVACNCYVLTDPKTQISWVLDPGGYSPRMKQAVGQKDVQKILLTHGHYDHTGGLTQLHQETDAPVCLHADELDLYNDPGSNLSGSHDFTQSLPDVQHILCDGDTLNLGEVTLTVQHTPGHTPGSVVIRGPEVVFTGDTLFDGSVGRTDLPEGSSADLTESLRRVSQMPAGLTVYPGHGPQTTMSAQLRTNPYLQNIDGHEA